MSKAKVAAEALARTLGNLVLHNEPVSVWGYLPDSFSPPGIVVGQPTFDYEQGRLGGPADIAFPVFVAVARTADDQLQTELLDLLDLTVETIDLDETLDGCVHDVRLVRAEPRTIATGGAELPGYEITVVVTI